MFNFVFIFLVLTYMVNEMAEFIFQYNSQILPPIWQLLTQTADIYVKVVVNESDTNEGKIENGNCFILKIFPLNNGNNKGVMG